MRDEDQRRAKKEKLFQFYRDPNAATQCSDMESVKTLPTDDDILNIDGSSFNARAYLEKHLKEKDLSDLILEEKVLTEQIRSLDSEMQTLMYDNYSKFISATDTIRLMKSDFKYVEKEMDCLVKNMSSIGARDRLNATVAALQEKTSGVRKSTKEQGDLQNKSTESVTNSTSADYTRPDILHFANLLTDHILDELSGFASAYASLFAAEKSMDKEDESECTVM
ncbi:unnamed protein product [Echinostoma caproni]|uniref:Vacuolar protein sorting-associated protein 51 homolog n=1 Tax=Echinostoma caproni TaxID=27848 RepID=A0A183BDX2_9TREM|nr:unnamed protein product [Echinostoma caproni]